MGSLLHELIVLFLHEGFHGLELVDFRLGLQHRGYIWKIVVAITVVAVIVVMIVTMFAVTMLAVRISC